MKLLITFIALTIINVIIQTIKSIATIKCGKWLASAINAVAYGIYTYVVFFTASDGIDLHIKALITAIANLIGVFVVKYCEEKARKDKLWKVEATVPFYETDHLHAELKDELIDHNYVENVGNWSIFNIYCPTQEQSRIAKQILDRHQAKYFVSESKTL